MRFSHLWGDFAEDYGCIVRILYHAKSLSYIEKPLYHYVIRLSSECNIRSMERNFQLHKINKDGISDFLKDKKGFKNIRNYIQLFFKFTYKNLFIDKPEDWYKLNKESHKAIFILNSERLKARLFWSILFIHPKVFLTVNRLNKKMKGKSLLE